MGQALNAQGKIVTFPDPTSDQRMAAAARSVARQLPGYIADKSRALRLGGITVSGIPIGTDVEGMTLLAGAHDFLQANPSATLQFVVSPKQTVTLNAAQIIGMWAAVTTFVQACFAAEAQANAGINAVPPTIATTAQVDALFAAVTRAY